MSNKKLRIVPLGGLGEVGKNMMVYEYGQNILIVDTGLMFPENDMLGIDYIIPDFRYLEDKADLVRGIVITHGHEDHTGAIAHVVERFNAPIYATPLTRGLLEAKLARSGSSSKARLNTIQPGDTIWVGPFQVEFFHVCHSIPDGVGLGITTPAGLVIHTGDYKFDHTPVDEWPTDYAKLAELSNRGVLALLADSTNADRPGWTPSEKVIDGAFRDVFRNATGRIIVASFASLISRMQQVGNAALEHRRQMAFVGASMVENAKIARKLGYLDLPDDLVISLEQALKLDPSKVVLMSTGTQGEPTSIIGRLSMGTNQQFDLQEGDTVVLSSHPIPGNEESVYRTINRLFRRGATVIYEGIAPVHVSGHASQEEMKLLLHLVKPRFFIPIHGELRHLHQHASLARQVGLAEENIAVIENGHVIEFEDNQMRIGERVPGGYVFVDGAGVGDIGVTEVREREALARDGFVLVNLSLDETSRRLRDDPEIITRGFIQNRTSDDIIDGAHKVIQEAVRNGNGNLQEDLQEALRSYLFNRTRRRPMVFVTLSRS
ncbi:MAG: ribonuclease J [Anaerolineae bacterium UTCFX2]|nr:ribonuclease J [Anaerolineae bacterium]MCZ7552641.1 ribonuclease J [Anaerolineales bacterium]OQY93391.1 MAG: ribonuclease J [Anaerolineae bacterium UTCFX2]